MQFTSEITVKLHDVMGSDHSICEAARVSVKGSETLTDSSDSYGLISYLMKHRHGSPFEHNCLTFWVEAPIFVWREHHRHRIGFSYNETSARYKALEGKFYVPDETRPIKAVGSSARPTFVPDSPARHQVLCECLKNLYGKAYSEYEYLLGLNYPREIARNVLPVAIYSQCFVTCNLRSLMHFLSLRTHSDDALFVSYPQFEIELVAKQYESIFAARFPLAYRAFVENRRVAP